MSRGDTFPRTLKAFDQRRKEFEAWLVARGSAIKQRTNPYEVIRFATSGADGIVYRKGNDAISHWTPEAIPAYRAFLDGATWRAIKPGKRDRKTFNLILGLAERDGWTCCYCATEVDMETATVEHFLSVTSGGSNHLSNLSLACQPCNVAAGHLSVREKIELAIQKRSISTCPELPPSS